MKLIYLIINVSSVGGRIAMPFTSLYNGTKFAIEGISESLALELAPHGIRVKIIEPGALKLTLLEDRQGLLSGFSTRS